MKQPPRYRATVFLKQTIKTEAGEAHPCLNTSSFYEKAPILNLVKALYDQGVIVAYRMTYSPDGDESNYYFDHEVVYLEDGAKHVSLLSS